MASKIELVIEAMYKNRAAIVGAIGDLKKLDKASESSSNSMAASNKQTAGLTDKLSALKSALLPVVGVIAAVGVAAKKAFDFAAEGAMIQLTTDRFNTLAESIGTVGTALTIELKAATQGAATNLELMAGASRLMAMGLVSSQEQLGGMLSMISRLKQPTDDLSTAIENFSLLIANRSILRLDSFNISGARTKDILEEMGIASAQAATDAEFLAAVMKAGEESMNRMGVASGNTTTTFVTLGAAWKNLIDEMKKDTAQGEGIGNLLSGMSESIQVEVLKKQLADLGISIEDIRAKGRDVGLIWDAMGSNASLKNLGAPALSHLQRIEFLTDLLLQQANAQAELAILVEATRSQEDDMNGAFIDQENALTRVAAARDDDNEALRLAHDLFAKANPLFAKDNEILRDRERALRAAANAESAHTAQLERMAASEAAARARALELNAAMQERRSLMEQELTRSGDVSPLAQQIFDLGEAAGAGAQAVGALLIATGQFSEAAVEQAVKAAILKQALDEIIAAFFAGETSAKTAADAIKVWQQSINDMSVQEALQKLGTLKATLDALPRNIPITVTVTVDDATGAITWNRNGQTTQSNAAGTAFFPGGWSWVGEQGPELVQMPRGTQILSNPQSMNHAAQAAGNYTFNISVTGNANRQDFKRIVQTEVGPLLDRREERATARRRS